MSTIYKFRALSIEDEGFVREYEIKPETSLLDFHKLISRDLNFDESNMASFFTSDGEWTKLDEYALVNISDENFIVKSMADVTVGELVGKPKDRLIYLFDLFSERALYIEMTGTCPVKEKVVYPFISLSIGDAPIQHLIDDNIEELSVFDEVMSEFSDFEGDDMYDDEF